MDVPDAQGRRISKSVGGSNTDYLYAGTNICAEYSGGWSQAAAYYVSGPGVDAPLSRHAGGVARYYHQDGLGSVVAVTDSSGVVQGSQRFSAFGEQLASTGSIPQYGYTGREPDATGLIYYRARYYDPNVGRFTQRDPLGFVDGVNRYAYAMNSPVNFVGPMGTDVPGSTSGNITSYPTNHYPTDFQTSASMTSGSNKNNPIDGNPVNISTSNSALSFGDSGEMLSFSEGYSNNGSKLISGMANTMTVLGVTTGNPPLATVGKVISFINKGVDIGVLVQRELENSIV